MTRYVEMNNIKKVFVVRHVWLDTFNAAILTIAMNDIAETI